MSGETPLTEYLYQLLHIGGDFVRRRNRFLRRGDILESVAGNNHGDAVRRLEPSFASKFDETGVGSRSRGFGEHAAFSRQFGDGGKDFGVADGGRVPARSADRVKRFRPVVRRAYVDTVGDRVRGAEYDFIGALLNRPVDRAGAFRLNADDLRNTVDDADVVQVVKALVRRADDAAVADGNENFVGNVPAALFRDLHRAGLFAFDEERVDRAVAVVPAVVLDGLDRQTHRGGVISLDEEHPRTEHEQLRYFGDRRRFRNEDHAFQSHVGGETRERTGGVTRRRAGENVAVLFRGERHGDGAGAVFERSRGISPVVFDQKLSDIDDERIFVVAEALRRGITPEEINAITKIDIWFIDRIQSIVDMEHKLAEGLPDSATLRMAKELGFADTFIAELVGTTAKVIKELRKKYDIHPSFKMVDTCAAEFDAQTPYYYSTYDGENEAIMEDNGKKKVLVLGSGPIRIGQGIEFDYCSVHSVWALKRMGLETIIINNNPETVSTDFDIADRLYFEPLTAEDVEHVVELEKPWGAVVQFGGQTAIKLAKALTEMGVPILGTSADGVDAAEDRERFDIILNKCEIPRAEGRTVFTTEQALAAANAVGYPVLVRPSYVLGGQGMEIAYKDQDIVDFMKIINMTVQEHPILVDKYLMGREVEVDGVFDGEDVLIPGIMEHVERAGIHSGDSIAVYPPLHIDEVHKQTILKHTRNLAKHLGVIGLINVQFIIYNDTVYIIEANPRSSRTIPYISKVTNVPIIDLATKVMLGAKLKDLGYGTGIYPEADYFACKMPVFSFEKLTDVDINLGPEMKSTGECLGIAESYPQALLKAFKGANMKVPKKGSRVIITVKDEDKGEAVGVARELNDLGVELFATQGTYEYLKKMDVDVQKVNRLGQAHPNLQDMIQSGSVDMIINTPQRRRQAGSDGIKIRRMAVEHSILCLTSLDTAHAILTARERAKSEDLTPIDITAI